LIEVNKLDYKNYLESVFFYCETDPSFKTKFEYMEQIKKDFTGSKKFVIDFPKEIQDNFLKIVSNIFYLTAFETYVEFKGNYLDKKFDPETKPADVIYQKHLKIVRRKVYSFFNIAKHYKINSKFLVRLCPLSLNKNNIVRQNYDNTTNQINQFLDNLILKIIPTNFLNQSTDSKLMLNT